jgi:hypothetical protein
MGGKVKIYYGLSGTLKSTSIRKYLEYDPEAYVMWSSIKVWKNNRNLLFPWLSGETNLNYTLLHLTRLEEINYQEDTNYIIERGVTDYLYYESLKNQNLITPEVIKRAVDRESEIIGNSLKLDVHKTLMIMHDKKFIAEKVLSEKSRAECFKNPDDYLQKQEEYVDFTKTYNKISEIVDIENAWEYLEKVLGIKPE